MSAFDVLSQLLESSVAPTPEGVLAEMVRRASAERGFLAWGGKVWAVDLDGMTLGHGAARLPPRTLRGPKSPVLRRSEPGSVLAAELATGVGRVGLVLEHRFTPGGFSELSDEEFLRWVVVAGVAVRWSSAADQSETPNKAAAEGPAESLVASQEATESVSALSAHEWNISRAARSLGMTRHGLKKRMARLGISRPAQKLSAKA